MSERSNPDDVADRAIEELREDGEHFAFLRIDGDKTRVLSCMTPDEEMLAVWILVEHARDRALQDGVRLSPADVALIAGETAAEAGFGGSEQMWRWEELRQQLTDRDGDGG